MTSAASTSPSLTSSIAFAWHFAGPMPSQSTRTGSIALNRSSAYFDTSIVSPPRSTSFCSAGTRFTNATLGLSGPRESAKPISTEITTG